MANLPESDEFPVGVYQLEMTDPVVGGAPNAATGAGMANIPHQHLAARTRWLKTRVDTLVALVVGATSSVAGIVKLSTAINSTSTTTAATPSAVKAANDNAETRALKTTALIASGLVTGGGDLSTNRTITVKEATQAEAEEGTSSTTAMTPLRVAQAIAAKIANYAPTSRTISASGLATGGGDLSANRTITVPAATQAEAEAGTSSTTAMTPLRVAQAIAARLAGIVKIGTQLVVGHGGGAVALTVNDGGGNASVCFNHTAALPDQNGNSARITVNTDAAVSSQIDFSVASGVVAEVAPTMINMLRMTEGGTVLLMPLIGGNGAGSAGNLLQSMGAGLPPIWVNRKYVSPKTVIANATNYTFSHGLGEMPAMVSVALECVTAQAGFVAGDVIEVGYTSDFEGLNEGIAMRKTASQLVVMIGNNGAGGYTAATGGGGFGLLAANWKLIVTAIL